MDDQRARIDKAVSQITACQVFWGALLTTMKFEPCGSIKTADVDGVTIRYNPAYVASLSDAQLQGLLAHEVSHPALGHIWRMMGREPGEWNIACDFKVNQILRDAGFTLPPAVLFDDSTAEMSEDEIYADRMRRRSQQPQDQGDESEESPQSGDNGDDESQSSGDSSDGEDSNGAGDSQKGDSDSDDPGAEGEGDGSDAGRDGDDSASGEAPEGESDPEADGQGGEGSASASGVGDPGEDSQDYGGCGEMRAAPNADGTAEKATPEDIERLKDDWETRTFQAAKLAKKAGMLPGSLERLVNEMKRPDVDPCDLLREFMQHRAKSDFKSFPFNRRFLPHGFYFPSLQSESLDRLDIAVDLSGSIGDEELALFAGWINSVLADVPVRLVRVIYFDDGVRSVEEFTADDYPVMIRSLGGGGTDILPVFQHIADSDDGDPDAFVCLTDLDFYMGFPEEPAFPVCWLSTALDYAPFGTVVMMHETKA